MFERCGVLWTFGADGLLLQTTTPALPMPPSAYRYAVACCQCHPNITPLPCWCVRGRSALFFVVFLLLLCLANNRGGPATTIGVRTVLRGGPDAALYPALHSVLAARPISPYPHHPLPHPPTAFIPLLNCVVAAKIIPLPRPTLYKHLPRTHTAAGFPLYDLPGVRVATPAPPATHAPPRRAAPPLRLPRLSAPPPAHAATPPTHTPMPRCSSPPHPTPTTPQPSLL